MYRGRSRRPARGLPDGALLARRDSLLTVRSFLVFEKGWLQRWLRFRPLATNWALAGPALRRGYRHSRSGAAPGLTARSATLGRKVAGVRGTARPRRGSRR